MKPTIYLVSILFLTACESTPNIEQIRLFSTSTASVSSTLSAQGSAINRDTRRYFIREALENPGLSIRDSQGCSNTPANSNQSLPRTGATSELLFCLKTPTLNRQQISAIAQVFSTLGAYSQALATLSADGLRSSATTAIDTLETQLTTANTALMAANIQGEDDDTISEVSAVIQLLSRAIAENQRRKAVRDTIAEAIPRYRSIIDRYEITFVEYAKVRQLLPRTRFAKASEYYEFREETAGSDKATVLNLCQERFSEPLGVNICTENYDNFSTIERRQLLSELEALAPLQDVNFDTVTTTLFTRMKAVLDELETVVEQDLSADTDSFRNAVREFSSAATAYTRVSSTLELPALGD